MKKKLTVVLCLVLALLLLTGCASQTISKAKAAYESGDYQTVVDLLQDLKSSKPEVAELLRNAKIHLAFDAGDYQQVVDLIGDADVQDADIASLLKNAKTALEEEAAAEAAKAAEEALLAEAQAAFDNGEFEKVVTLLGDQGIENEAFASLVKDAQAAIKETEAQEALEAKVVEAQKAYDAGDYQTVVDLINDSGMESEELTGLADRAKAALQEEAEAAKAAEEALIVEVQAAFDAGDYEKVVEILGEQPVDNEAVAALLKDAEAAIEEAAKAEDAEKAAAEETARAAAEAAAEEAAKAEEAARAAEEAAKAEEAKLAEEAAAIEAKLAEVQSAYDSGDYQAVVEMANAATVESEEIAALAVLAQTALDEEAAAAEAAAALEAKLAEVKTALDAEDYNQVIALVKEADIESDELTQLAAEAQTALDEIALREAKLTEVKAAFDEEDYEKVVELVKGTDIESDELTQLAAEAQTALDEIAAREAKLAEVKAAFDGEDYEKVVELVSNSDIESVELTELAAEAQTRLAEIAAHEAWLAEIKAAYEDENYAKVVELVGDGVPDEAEVSTMLSDSRIQVAYQNGDYAEVVELMAEYDGKDSSEIYTNSIREVAREAIFATGDDRYIQFPEESSYLSTFKTRYIVHLDYDWWVFKIFDDVDDALEQQRACGPCVPVERYPRTDGGHTMPWAYEGTEVTVLAEQNDMSLILYLSSENKQRCGWVQNRFLVDSFPSRQVTIGEPRFTDVNTVRDIGMSWSKKGFLTTQQNYSVLSETVENCVGFTLDYQLIAENTDKWNCIFGPRSIYVNDGSDWIKVGTFDYPTQGTVKVTVNLDEPIDIVAIGTIAEVGMPNVFYFRQYATEYQVLG